MQDIFEPHQKRGINNSIMLNDSGLVIFQQIGQLKSDGLTVSDIRDKIEQSGISKGRETAADPVQTGGNGGGASFQQDSGLRRLYDELDQERKRVIAEKEKRLETETNMRAIQAELRLLLPEGKSPEHLRKEQEQMRMREAAMMGRIDAFRQKTLEEKEKRLEVEADLRVMQSELSQLLPQGRSLNEAKNKLRMMQVKRAEIIGRLENLKFWNVKQRKVLIKNLKALEYEMFESIEPPSFSNKDKGAVRQDLEIMDDLSDKD